MESSAFTLQMKLYYLACSLNLANKIFSKADLNEKGNEKYLIDETLVVNAFTSTQKIVNHF